MKRALVTGSAGFVGRHMVRELLARDYDVCSLDVRPWPKDAQHVGTTSVHTFNRVDAIDFFIDGGPEVHFDLVVHCAYMVGGREAIDSSRTNLTNNLLLDSNLFEWAGKARPDRIIYFSSSAAYPIAFQNMEYIEACEKWQHEWHLTEDIIQPSGLNIMTPDADYGWAKLTGERLARNAQAQGQKVTVLRPFSGYGGDQDLTYPFPSFIERVKRGDDPIEVWGDATQRRDWIHIDDVVKGALAIAENGTEEPVNLCTGMPTAVGDLIIMMAELAGRVETPELDVLRDKPMGVHSRVGDPTRMLSIYAPKINLADGILRALRGEG